MQIGTVSVVCSSYLPAHIDDSSDEDKDDFYRELSMLIHSAKSSNILILAGDMNAQIDRLHSDEAHFGGCFSVDTQRTENGQRYLESCTDHQLFLAYSNFQHRSSLVLLNRGHK